MDRYDDIVGLPLWTIPPSDEEVRAEFIRSSHAQITELREIDPNEHTGSISVPITNFPIEDGASPEDISLQVNKAIVVLESMTAACENGKAGQSVLTAVLKDNMLHGFILNPETGVTMTATAPIHTPAGMEVFRLPIVLGIIGQWAENQNAIAAWGAIRAMNDEIEFPDSVPSE